MIYRLHNFASKPGSAQRVSFLFSCSEIVFSTFAQKVWKRSPTRVRRIRTKRGRYFIFLSFACTPSSSSPLNKVSSHSQSLRSRKRHRAFGTSQTREKKNWRIELVWCSLVAYSGGGIAVAYFLRGRTTCWLVLYATVKFHSS